MQQAYKLFCQATEDWWIDPNILKLRLQRKNQS